MVRYESMWLAIRLEIGLYGVLCQRANNERSPMVRLQHAETTWLAN